jgi:superfamily II DNA or RNA helicase
MPSVYSVYIKTNPEWNTNNKEPYYKCGYTGNCVRRLYDDHETHSYLSTYKSIFTIVENNSIFKENFDLDKIIFKIGKNQDKIALLEKKHNCELITLRNIHKHIRNDGGGTEFIDEVGILLFENIILYEFPLLNIKTKKLTDEEVEQINITSYNKYNQQTIETEEELENMFKNIEEDLEEKQCQEIEKDLKKQQKKNEQQLINIVKDIEKDLLQQQVDKQDINTKTWNERTYQTQAISYCTNELTNKNKTYIDMATGSGKTYTTFKIMSYFTPEIVVIISPRKKINTQNTTSKYLTLLNETYETYNLSNSNSKDFDTFYKQNKKNNKKNLIISCYQSSEKLYNIIKNYNNIFVWFDEAHWGAETWINNKKQHTKFLLHDKQHITYRLFSSASPNKEIIDVYSENIFGQYYSPIKVSELIKQKYLCPIVPHIYGLDENNIDICEYTIDNFNKFNSTYGFSFHHTQKNASELFNLHYLKFKENKTTIKPYLLISGIVKKKNNNEDNENNENNEDNEDNENNFNSNNIDLPYSFMHIDSFEKDYTKNMTNNYTGCIGYTCKQYTMGYDFNKIDYIVFSDAKVSYPDIIQCIGRGTRPDNLGENGTNKDKKLNLMIPAYINNNNNPDEEEYDKYAKFKNIVQVLKYLIKDIELDFKSIDIDKRKLDKTNKKNKEDKHTNINDENKYDGEETIQSQLLKLVMQESEWNEKKIIRQLKENRIYSPNSYIKYCKERPDLKLPQFSKLYTRYEKFCWADCAPNGMFYKTSEECKEAINELKQKYKNIDFNDYDIPEKKLNKLDNKIYPYCLDEFYRTIRKQYY